MSRWDDFVDDHSWVSRILSVRKYLPPLNFITIHYAYFIVVCLISSVIFWQSSDPASPISYTDSLFLVVSAMTEAGLNTVNLSALTTWQQTMLFLLIMLGSTVWVSMWTVLARKHVFKKRFDDIVRAERVRRLSQRGSSMSLTLPKLRKAISFRKAQTVPVPDQNLPAIGNRALKSKLDPEVDRLQVAKAMPKSRRALSLPDLDLMEPPRASAGPEPEPRSPDTPDRHIVFVDTLHRAEGSNATSTGTSYFNERRPTRRNGAAKTPADQDRVELSIRHFLGSRSSSRNGQFHSLTSEERENLGGCEYRALKALGVLVPLYYFLWQFLGCVALGAWMNNNMPDTAKANGINPWWLGVFNGVSAFNNSGMSLLDANMIPFQNAYFVLITMGLMILAGNTAYPLFLRLIVWIGLKLLKAVTKCDANDDLKATFEFILKYPRRVYTNLFPSRPTWWLFFMLIWLNSIDWVAFEIMNIGNSVIESIPTGSRILDGLFQALAVRSGGFYVVPISQVYIGLQVLYVIMMYISVYPVVITMRHSNVYEERSLGIYSGDGFSTSDADLEAAAPLFSADGHDSESHIHASTTNGALSTAPTLVRRLSRSSAAVDIGHALQRTFTWNGVGAPPAMRGNKSYNGPTPNRPGGSSSKRNSRIGFISQQIHRQLAHDIWWLVLAVLVITTIETSYFMADPVAFSVFNIIFEVVSAYGTVGISVGIPRDAYSFSGAWHTDSKLVLCLVMLRGRHRGLPVALDHAVEWTPSRLLSQSRSLVLNESLVELKNRREGRLVLELREEDAVEPEVDSISHGSGLARKTVRRIEIFRLLLFWLCLATASPSCDEFALMPLAIRLWDWRAVEDGDTRGPTSPAIWTKIRPWVAIADKIVAGEISISIESGSKKEVPLYEEN
ncbi:hypothetical protein FOXB_15765 [Fusarium oxysporum f. sp. conglutinans Fo5176]|uniref:Potassium transport protein n=1 Tax=Fusarium oxysporum (strain Fo5176) TaxID=660025 RepID=F9GAT3_FUSOF|nr:hypothetical protein FOXB_15765 [Fusarium oxysporum f. sp. conglutinans Fo5176]